MSEFHLSSNYKNRNIEEINPASSNGKGDQTYPNIFDFTNQTEIKAMLDSHKDSIKLEGMKKTIQMIAEGRDASSLFSTIVKNVVSKNFELKKLVYLYLKRYSEKQQNLTLLSISTFQKALKEPNQLIRASALRTLSSIPVKIISPVVLLAIQEASNDLSPYVRKIAAHAVLKLYDLHNDLKPELTLVIQKLLNDKTVLVIASAIMAFSKVCPEKIEFIHETYRKLCMILIDVDEWGQVIIINMLTRYARSQFIDPNNLTPQSQNVDTDLNLLLKCAKPLLQSQNSAVVMTVIQLFYYVAPKNELHSIIIPLIRLLRAPIEIQSVIIKNILSISSFESYYSKMFIPHLKKFFLRNSDSSHIKLMKLKILTNLAVDTSTSEVILSELKSYINNSDRKIIIATIQAIGRCGLYNNKNVTNSCLMHLISLLTKKNEVVISESVIVIKKLLMQIEGDDLKISIIYQMVKLLDDLSLSEAKATILFLVGEYCQKLSNIAPDILRKMTKTFHDESNIVKMQIINLAMKLFLINPNQVELIFKYLLNMAQFDENYDIRDKARMFKQFVFTNNLNTNKNVFTLQAERIYLASKPNQNGYCYKQNQEAFQLGSLSHYMNKTAKGYTPLPEFPKNPSTDGIELRNIDVLNCFKNEESGVSEKKDEVLVSDLSNSYSSDRLESDSSGSSSSEFDEESTFDGSVNDNKDALISEALKSPGKSPENIENLDLELDM